MAELIIEWDRDRLIVAKGSASATSVAFSNVFSVAREADETPEQLGGRLRQHLNDARMTDESAVVVLPRQLVTLRRVQLPAIPDDELPDMVKLQAATRLTVPIESVCLDFIPLPVTGEGRDVLMVTVPAEHVVRVRTTLAAASLELASVCVSSFGIVEMLVLSGQKTVTEVGSVDAVVCLCSDMIELLLLNGRSVVFSHTGASWTSPDGIEPAVRAEIARAWMAATEAIGPQTVNHLTLVGDPQATSALPVSVTERLNNANLTRLDPGRSIIRGRLSDDLTASDMLAVAGVIVGRQRPSVEIVDLVNPRRPLEKTDNRRLKAVLTVGATLLLTVGFWSWRESRITELEAQKEDLDRESGQLATDYRDAKPELDKDSAVSEWLQGDVNWLDEMNRIREILGGTRDLLLRDMQFSSGFGNLRGTITMECYARSEAHIQAFMRRLDSSGYDVVAAQTKTASDPEYSSQMTLRLDLPVENEES